MVDSIDLVNELSVRVNSAKKILVDLWSKLASPTQEIETIGKKFVGIYTVERNVLLYVLLDSDSKPTHELNCL